MELLPPSKYFELRDVLKRNLPSSIYAQYLIENLIEWHKNPNLKNIQWGSVKSVDLDKINVFVPKTGLQNGTFIIIDDLKVQNYLKVHQT